MKSNKLLQEEVQEALQWEPHLEAVEIKVFAKDGNVTLSGIVDSNYQKEEAERIVWNYPGVDSVDNQMTIDVDL
jgi:osmotically-inducible protein OsmY